MAAARASRVVLTAFFSRRMQAQAALERLAEAGLGPSDVSVLRREATRKDDLGLISKSKAAGGVALGGVLGGFVGGMTGALAGAGSLVLPALGVVVAGPIVSGLAAAAVFGAAGAIAGAIVGVAIPEYEAAFLEGAASASGAVMAVCCTEDRTGTVVKILVETGGRCLRQRGAR